jgi:hypothetical protein
MASDLRVLIASVPDREHVVVEIWRANVQIAEVSRTSDGDRLEIYFLDAEDGRLVLDLPEFMESLEQAEAEFRRT